MTTAFTNPILPGFHPDPSMCRVGEDFYLVTSTFEFFPGLPIYHSRDLIHWEVIGHGLSRTSQMPLVTGGANAFGIYAPTIRFINGRFYLICTNVAPNEKRAGNFIIWTDDIYGAWSEPIWLDLPGIDPSLFQDDDGTVYYTGTDGDIYLATVDLATGKTGARIHLWAGAGYADIEGPHLYKKDGWYYLLISEGGTSYGHMLTMARSRNITGPYASYENNPVLTNRSTNEKLQATGHADLFQDAAGNWWAVCLAVRPISYPLRHLLGRETNLMPVVWPENEWPVFGDNGHIKLEISGPLPETSIPEGTTEDWVSRYEWDDELLVKKETQVLLHPNTTTLSDEGKLAFCAIRQTDFDTELSGEFSLPELGSCEAGLTAYLNPRHHYEIALQQDDNGKRQLFLRRQIGSLWKVEKEIPVTDTSAVKLILAATKETYTFSYQFAGQDPVTLGTGETQYLTTEVGGVFTGILLGAYATKATAEPIEITVENLILK